MQRTDSFEKTLMLGKIEGRRRRGWQRMRWLGGITDSMMSLSKLWESVMASKSHPPLSPSAPAFSFSQHQGLFQWVSSLHQVAKLLESQHQHQFFQWTCRTDFLYDWLVGSFFSSRDTQESSPTPQFKTINSLVLSFLYSPTLTSIHDHWKKHSFD